MRSDQNKQSDPNQEVLSLNRKENGTRTPIKKNRYKNLRLLVSLSNCVTRKRKYLIWFDLIGFHFIWFDFIPFKQNEENFPLTSFAENWPDTNDKLAERTERFIHNLSQLSLSWLKRIAAVQEIRSCVSWWAVVSGEKGHSVHSIHYSNTRPDAILPFHFQYGSITRVIF